MSDKWLGENGCEVCKRVVDDDGWCGECSKYSAYTNPFAVEMRVKLIRMGYTICPAVDRGIRAVLLRLNGVFVGMFDSVYEAYSLITGFDSK